MAPGAHSRPILAGARMAALGTRPASLTRHSLSKRSDPGAARLANTADFIARSCTRINQLYA